VLTTLKAVSDLTTLQKKPPPSINALRYRADSDTQTILKVLHSFGYYEASLQFNINEFDDVADIYVHIQTGPVYKLEDFNIHLHNLEKNVIICQPITLKNIGLKLGTPIQAKDILEAEDKILHLLSQCGYPLAENSKQTIIADGKVKTIKVDLSIDVKEKAFFSLPTITGLKNVHSNFIFNKTAWKKGDTYNSLQVEKTRQNLMDTGLFSSVHIAYNPVYDKSQEIPIKIDVIEGKHRNVNLGVSYQTFFGPGITLGWEHGNLGGMGRKLSFQADLTQKTHSGTVTFISPDFCALNQDYIFSGIVLDDHLETYDQRSYTLTNRIERRLNERYRFSYGIGVERIIVDDSAANGTFSLIDLPLYLRWSNSTNILNPTKGATFQTAITPTANISSSKNFYIGLSVSYAHYLPLFKHDWLILAQQLTFESLLTKNLDSVPLTKRVLGGSEKDLRGYKYRTVSPLINKNPTGGQSGIFYSLETRFKLNQTLGLVPFLDIGLVDTKAIPRLKNRWVKSTGIGLRYYTFLGPLRVDVAFPLNRRKEIDSFYRILVSIGQTF
jgi:translocation and assembly module TamA